MHLFQCLGIEASRSVSYTGTCYWLAEIAVMLGQNKKKRHKWRKKTKSKEGASHRRIRLERSSHPLNTACINSLIGTKLSSRRRVYTERGVLSHPRTAGGIEFFSFFQRKNICLNVLQQNSHQDMKEDGEGLTKWGWWRGGEKTIYM